LQIALQAAHILAGFFLGFLQALIRVLHIPLQCDLRQR